MPCQKCLYKVCATGHFRHPASYPLHKHVGNSDLPPCWPWRGWQLLNKRWISGNIHHVHFYQVQMKLPTLALKPRGDIIISPRQGYQWSHKKDISSSKFFFKKKHRNNSHVKAYCHKVSSANQIGIDMILFQQLHGNGAGIGNEINRGFSKLPK